MAKKTRYLQKTVGFAGGEITLFSLDGVTWSSRKEELEAILQRHEQEKANFGGQIKGGPQVRPPSGSASPDEESGDVVDEVMELDERDEDTVEPESDPDVEVFAGPGDHEDDEDEDEEERPAKRGRPQAKQASAPRTPQAKPKKERAKAEKPAAKCVAKKCATKPAAKAKAAPKAAAKVMKPKAAPRSGRAAAPAGKKKKVA